MADPAGALSRGRRLRTMGLEASEFIRRFLLHALPKGFVRIRRYGLLANTQRELKLARCRELLGSGERTMVPAKDVPEGPSTEITPNEPGAYRCPSCGEGLMRRVHGLILWAALRPRPPPVLVSS